MSAKWQKFELDLSDYSPAEREAIALEVIDQIVKRTKAGKDKNGSTFSGYSKDYKESLSFKIAGKTSRVDLTLSGDMLDSLQILSNRSGKVTIGYERGSDENGKADGNIRGTYGHDKKVGPARDFLGVSDDELAKITKRYPPETKRSEERAIQRLQKEKAAARLSGAVDVQTLDTEDQ